ncbi:hypothetical protein NGM10_16425 (plasmid) [Halorussus salilacus]|uniref:hypothetical protein n=1 Tax=Halorussus salilacus TaxID=2953750 RepID=UPI00209E9FB7|nr:hypothetical protein [Halorussus salilacus]USZ69988.1 hypothetical protein NGM10_16425 [Halorussus salilacus]
MVRAEREKRRRKSGGRSRGQSPSDESRRSATRGTDRSVRLVALGLLMAVGALGALWGSLLLIAGGMGIVGFPLALAATGQLVVAVGVLATRAWAFFWATLLLFVNVFFGTVRVFLTGEGIASVLVGVLCLAVLLSAAEEFA